MRYSLGAALVFGVCLATIVTGQSQSASLRTPWGDPALAGRWTNATVTLLERPVEFGAKEFFTEEEALEYSKTALQRFIAATNSTDEAAVSGEFDADLWGEARAIVPTRRTSLIIGPTGRLPPLTPEAQRRAKARGPRQIDFADNPEDRTLGERCLWFAVGGPPMMPGLVYNSNYEIVQTPTHVVILAEMGFAVRVIPIGNHSHPPPSIREWQGDSVGRWDGDTLVVETTNFNDKVVFRGSTRENLRIIERFTRVSPELVMYQFTAEDPSTWITPWTAEIPMRKLDGLLYEYACHEGNKSLENILRGARAAAAMPQN